MTRAARTSQLGRSGYPNPTMIEMYSRLYTAILDTMASGARRHTGSFSYGDLSVFLSTSNQTIHLDVLRDFIQTVRRQLLRELVGALYQATLHFLLRASTTLAFLNGLASVMMDLSGDREMIVSAQKLKKHLFT